MKEITKLSSFNQTQLLSWRAFTIKGSRTEMAWMKAIVVERKEGNSE